MEHSYKSKLLSDVDYFAAGYLSVIGKKCYILCICLFEFKQLTYHGQRNCIEIITCTLTTKVYNDDTCCPGSLYEIFILRISLEATDLSSRKSMRSLWLFFELSTVVMAWGLCYELLRCSRHIACNTRTSA